MNRIISRFNLPRRLVAITLAVALLGGYFMLPQPTVAATVLSDGFGTGSNDNDIDDWNEEGTDSDSTTLARQGQGSGEDISSPNAGRFAKIADNEWICRSVDTEGLENLTLKYYWNGDPQTENGEDFGLVEYKAN